MKTVTIRLTMMTDNVKNFVSLVNRYPYDMDLRSGRYVVDAKSIMGLFSLDLSQPVQVKVHGSAGLRCRFTATTATTCSATWTATSSRTMGRTLPNNRRGTIIQNRRCGSCLLTRMLRKKKTS